MLFRSAVLLFSNGLLGDKFYVPFWVVLSCHAVIGLGTLMGGWKIVNTMGNKVTKLKPVGGFCAETGAGASILVCSLAGIPVSTTHTLVGAVLGVGLARGIGALDLRVVGTIILSWVITLPTGAALAAFFFYFFKGLFSP